MEIVGPTGTNPVSARPAARPAEQQEAPRSPTEGSGNRSTSPKWGSAIYSPLSPAYAPFSPLFTPQSPSYNPNSPRSPSCDPISPPYEPLSPSHEPRPACSILPSPREENPCLRPNHRPEAGHRDRPTTLSDTSFEEDILAYSLGSEEEGKPPEAGPPTKVGDRHRSRSPGGFTLRQSHSSPHSFPPGSVTPRRPGDPPGRSKHQQHGGAQGPGGQCGAHGHTGDGGPPLLQLRSGRMVPLPRPQASLARFPLRATGGQKCSPHIRADL